MSELRLGLVGLGRLGAYHARNLVHRVPGAVLMALCALEKDRVEEVRHQLNVPNGYTDIHRMLDHEDLDAVVIASPSDQHGAHLELAMESDLHVFVEKPLGTTLEQCLRAEKVAKEHPDLKCMVGFMRRFDPSYRDVKTKIDAGLIGAPILFRGYSVDPVALIEGALSFGPESGGQFLDMAVHDFDLARWLLGSEGRSVAAFGGCYSYPQFADDNDGDSVACLMQFANSAMGFFYAGRLAAHGYNVETEIIGTRGALRVGAVPQKNLVEILGSSGVTRECSGSFIERFDQAFVNELTHFVDCVLEERTPAVGPADGTAATAMAIQATHAFRSRTLAELS